MTARPLSIGFEEVSSITVLNLVLSQRTISIAPLFDSGSPATLHL